jgi:hypothetical protein
MIMRLADLPSAPPATGVAGGADYLSHTVRHAYFLSMAKIFAWWTRLRSRNDLFSLIQLSAVKTAGL